MAASGDVIHFVPGIVTEKARLLFKARATGAQREEGGLSV